MTYKVSDAAINVLLKFLAMFVGLLATVSKSAYVETLKARIPKTVKTAQNTSGLSFPAFTQYVSCTKCSSLYTTEDCKIVSGREVSSKVCSYIQFPNHPQYSQRRPCNTILLKSVSQFGKTFLYPFQTYCYSNLIASLEYLIKQNEFITNCNKWRSRKVHNDILTDIYDGRVWKDFGNFLAESETNFLLGLNVDWFQPFTNCQYSYAVLTVCEWLCILNIPRSSRFKEKYILLNGIIPGPHEPKKTINDKLVNELLLLWKGVCMTDATGKNVNVRAALCMVACDIPALRKCLGFAGIKANKGCSKCLKLFPTPTFSSKTDYSGFNMEDRSNDQHKQAIQAYKKGKTKSEQNQAIKSTGVREGFLMSSAIF